MRIAEVVFKMLNPANCVSDEKVHYEILRFIQEFAYQSKYGRFAMAFSQITQPFVQLLKFAIVQRRSKTLRYLIYSFIQIYELLLARVTYTWKGKPYYVMKRRKKALENGDVLYDDEEDEDDYDDPTGKYYDAPRDDKNDEETKFVNQWRLIMTVNQQLCDRMLDLLTFNIESVRNNCIKFAKTLILTTTNNEDTMDKSTNKKVDKDKFSQRNIRQGHPFLRSEELNDRARQWLSKFINCLNGEIPGSLGGNGRSPLKFFGVLITLQNDSLANVSILCLNASLSYK